MRRTSTIRVATELGPMPLGRYKADGPASGEALRELIEARLVAGEDVVIDLTGIMGCPSSWLEEAIGGLARSGPHQGIEIGSLFQRVRIISTDVPVYAFEAERYLADAVKHQKNDISPEGF